MIFYNSLEFILVVYYCVNWKGVGIVLVSPSNVDYDATVLISPFTIYLY